MANSIGWGQATQNNTNGFGKYENTIGAASIYPVSYAGETALEGTAAFASVNSFLFDGVDEYFETSPLSFLDGETNASWSVWIKPTDNASTRVIMHSQRDGATAKNSQFFFWMLKGNRIDFNILIESFYIRGDISYINYGQWNHVCVTFDGTGSTPYTGNMYINGVDRTTATNLYRTLPTARTDVNFRIGEIQEAGGFAHYNPFIGGMDEVAIFKSTLSQAAVTEIYNSGVPNDLNNLSNASSPDFWLRMGENANYSSGTGNWTLVNQGSESLNATSVNMEEADKSTDVPT